MAAHVHTVPSKNCTTMNMTILCSSHVGTLSWQVGPLNWRPKAGHYKFKKKKKSANRATPGKTRSSEKNKKTETNGPVIPQGRCSSLSAIRQKNYAGLNSLCCQLGLQSYTDDAIFHRQLALDLHQPEFLIWLWSTPSRTKD